MSRPTLIMLAALSLAATSLCADAAPSGLEAGFRNPPPSARLRCYWWWLNGNVTKQSITRDLEQMKAKGYGGAIVVDAGGAEQQGNHPVPAGPLFGSPAWRALFNHALAEANRLGLQISLNIVSGWNLGGPMVKPENSAKLVTWSQTTVKGPAQFDRVLPQPKAKEGFYRDIEVLAYPLRHGPAPNPHPLRDLQVKSSFKEAGFSTPDTKPLLFDLPSTPGEQDTASSDVLTISAAMDPSGHLRWSVPPGDWEILRFGYTSSGSKVSTSSGAWQGLVIDYMDHDALEWYWKTVIDPILADAKPYVGKTLAYVVTDSWELSGVNWTSRFAQEFRNRRHYDITPYLPVFAGRIVDDREISLRFLNDLRKTIGDLVADEHYAAFQLLAKRYGMDIHPEAGGPHGAPLDALKCLGRSAFPQMEFWAKSPIHRVKDEDRFFVKEAASASHIYGKNIVAAEGLTSIGNHWNESLWSNLKPTFDKAICEGLNRLVWHAFTSSPKEMGIPGQEYFAGTHMNPQVTWWEQSAPFLAYLNRGQFMMQQGRFVADALYYYGDHVPNFVQLKPADPAKVMPGFDYDVTDEEVLLTRLSVKEGWLTLPEGMKYRILVLPDLPMISLAALQKIRTLVEGGATVLGRKPDRATGLDNDEQIRQIAGELWGSCDGVNVKEHRFGKGRIVCAGTGRELLLANHVAPDFEYSGAPADAIDYIHRSAGATEIYFVSNQTDQPLRFPALFRVAGKRPQIWDAVSGQIHAPSSFGVAKDSRTRVNLDLPPYGSAYVVFGSSAIARPAVPATTQDLAIEGSWHIKFTSPAAAPAEQDFATLRSWTESTDPALQYFSGTAIYTKTISVPAAAAGSRRLLLDLGEVGEIAEVSVNGKHLGTYWAPPMQAELTGSVKAGSNQIEIRVTNLWINRLKGDALLPESQRTTRTNITQLPKVPLRPSGLIGPVTLRWAR
jgi:hypothetical protein